MIRIERTILHAVRAASAPAELHQYLQRAIQLEHSTIPPYLTALFSLVPGRNDRIAALIRSIVVEEMLHLSIASNILVAIGGSPAINVPGFIPVYPGPLPMQVGGADFRVGIEPFSKALVENVFMRIEEPEDPIPIRAMALEGAVEEPTFATIGEFYAAVKDKLREFGDGVFERDTSRQMLRWFPPDELFPIVDVNSACRGIDIIVEEGEGTKTNPFESPGDPAHYYKFGEILNGREIVQTPDGGYAYGGDPVPFDEAGVYPIKPNARLADYAPGSQARERAEAFSYSYSSLLNALHRTFNGEPDQIDTVMGLMYELKVTAPQLMTTPLDDGSGLTAGPSFEYITRTG